MSRPRADLTGKVFGRLVVIARAERPLDKKPSKDAWWRVECKCGQIRVVRGSNLATGHTRSCGCMAKQYRRPLSQKPFRYNNPYS